MCGVRACRPCPRRKSESQLQLCYCTYFLKEPQLQIGKLNYFSENLFHLYGFLLKPSNPNKKEISRHHTFSNFSLNSCSWIYLFFFLQVPVHIYFFGSRIKRHWNFCSCYMRVLKNYWSLKGGLFLVIFKSIEIYQRFKTKIKKSNKIPSPLSDCPNYWLGCLSWT